MAMVRPSIQIDEGKFLTPIFLSPGGRARGWFEDEIIAYQEECAAERDTKRAGGR
jgi:predicted DNA-binding transcriptional regulator AlpA